MAKATFYNLDEEKRSIIYQKLKEFFEEEDPYNINVSNIVKKLDIARGSFYQYFENLDDCYFTILKKETGLIHHKFFDLWEKNNHDIEKTLYSYKEFLTDEFYNKNLKNLYRPNFFIFENSYLSHGKDFLNKHLSKDEMDYILYIMAVFHQLMKESILEEYGKDEFLKFSDKYINWLMGGIKNESF
ncbi:TetR/AcrR family transcriptional regulator [Peptoniphilus catoniae]|uniref:TetR/AcrR family transcriptional regulator n=1 Tax=Peptoniphilus catoniae TaxID=1660341 RepID=UPI0010FD35EB|nr:TetR/AcrR family transcriptional regulator [Peptoniphilus catoniae]